MPIVIASENTHKAQELKDILEQASIPVVLQTQLPLQIPQVAETGLTFVENAILKARNCCHYTKMAAIADDSGLEVEALNNRPGIYSARFAGPAATSSANIAKLLEELRGVPEAKRAARFQCVMVFLRNADDPTPIICQGSWEGRITLAPEGENGFGYDPVFWVPEYQCTAAKLSPKIKNAISHRAQALQKLIINLKEIDPADFAAG